MFCEMSIFVNIISTVHISSAYIIIILLLLMFMWVVRNNYVIHAVYSISHDLVNEYIKLIHWQVCTRHRLIV